ncbi:MAG TPA: FAD-dependent oxidoreductase [Vicinamibacteria bacterium]|nr:FAD-dependent oxidoreductase [Vicinamibacteria bacterium]
MKRRLGSIVVFVLAYAAVSSAQTAPALRYYAPLPPAAEPRVVQADLCVYGATPGGLGAAIQTHRLGKRAALFEFGRHLGGMTASGLGRTDFGNKAAIGGLAREFYRRLGRHYGEEESFYFEPKVAERTFQEMVREAGVEVLFEERLESVRKEGNRIVEMVMESGNRCRAPMFVDATYEGDLMAMARVSYVVGRESNARYDESLNGVHFGHPNHNFKVFVDPYVVEGDPKSGLLQGISADPPGEQGQGDHRVQAYNFRLLLTNVPENRLPFPKPAGYDPDRYTLLARYLEAGIWDAMNLNWPLKNGKTDLNNYGGFSTDNIGRNYEWPDGSYATRERIFQDHVTYQQGLLWFLSSDERVPEKVRQEVRTWGLPKDEFPTTGGWPHQLYIREARRMVGDLVMTEHHCVRRVMEPDVVGLAAYTMDSHNTQRVVRAGRVMNEGNVEVGGFPPYPISYRAIVPKESEAANLFVPVGLSSSHIAYGSIRMEPVFMVLGQSAATAALMAIEDEVPVQRVDYAKLRARLLAGGQALVWHGVTRQEDVEPPR